MSFNNETIWIIGAGSGIGQALAIELARGGACLILSGRNYDNLVQTRELLPENYHKIFCADVVNIEQMEQVWHEISQNHRIDRVIFMAAIYDNHTAGRGIARNLEILSVNLGGAMILAHCVVPYFREMRRGQIAFCASVAGYRGLVYGQPYCASKAGLINYAQSLHSELAHFNIDVKVINPGFVTTPLTAKNDFVMPFIIPAPRAAMDIARQLRGKNFEINTPWFFCFLMKIVRILPNSWFFWLMARVRAKLFSPLPK